MKKNLAENPIFTMDAKLDKIREIFDNMGNSLPQTMNISDTIISEQYRTRWPSSPQVVGGTAAQHSTVKQQV